jgi:hypothetical protein
VAQGDEFELAQGVEPAHRAELLDRCPPQTEVLEPTGRLQARDVAQATRGHEREVGQVRERKSLERTTLVLLHGEPRQRQVGDTGPDAVAALVELESRQAGGVESSIGLGPQRQLAQLGRRLEGAVVADPTDHLEPVDT